MWSGGHYRIDLLMGERISRIVIQIPGRFGTVSEPAAWPAEAADLIPASDGDPSNVRRGPFVMVDGVGVPIGSRSAGPLSELAAWTASLAADRLEPGPVFSAYLPRATGIGALLTPHADIESAGLRRLAPGVLDEEPLISGGISAWQGGTPFVVFAPATGGAWPPGVYELSLRWTDDRREHDSTWHLELRPGPLSIRP